MADDITDAERAANLAKVFMAERPDFRRSFIKSRIWAYQMMPRGDLRERALEAYGMVLTFIGYPDEAVGIEAAFLTDITANRAAVEDRERIAKLDRRTENLEAEYPKVLERLGRLEDSWVQPSDTP